MRWNDYFNEVMAGEYTGAASADQFFPEYLDERCELEGTNPIAAFQQLSSYRRVIEAIWGVASLYRILHLQEASAEELAELRQLGELESLLESRTMTQGENPQTLKEHLHKLYRLKDRWTQRLANRLQIGAGNEEGYMIINPCSFPRRLPLEFPVRSAQAQEKGGSSSSGGISNDPASLIKSAQFDKEAVRLVVEVPAFGFSWIPVHAALKNPIQPKNKLAEENLIRNEFLEVEIDDRTGGMRSIRDTRTQQGRLGQQLIYNPGSTMEVEKIEITQRGPAKAEIKSFGVLKNDLQEPIARFEQRFRLWSGRPILEVQVTWDILVPPNGYPWHSYYGARFAWRDERIQIVRGVNGQSSISTHHRPQSPDYLDLRSGKQQTIVFPQGYPFVQKHEDRMIDLIWIAGNEQQRIFEFAIALDREYAYATSLGLQSPALVCASAKSAPRVGPTGWLCHVDSMQLTLIRMRPLIESQEGLEIRGGRKIVCEWMETSGYSGSATIRFVRNPVRAQFVDGNGIALGDIFCDNDSIHIDFAAHDLLRIQIDFD